jgi:hypothetical protein
MIVVILNQEHFVRGQADEKSSPSGEIPVVWLVANTSPALMGEMRGCDRAASGQSNFRPRECC